MDKVIKELSKIVEVAEERARYMKRLHMVLEWVIQAHDNPDVSPQTLEFQINQLKEVIESQQG